MQCVEKNIENKKYYTSFYKPLHDWRDYDSLSKGYGCWYYDCLPKNKKAKILDIGCGDGKFLYYLKKEGYKNVEGLEVSDTLANITKRKTGCNVHVVNDTNKFLENNISSYDTITMNDVLEHIPKSNIIEILSAIKNALLPGGNIVINVPQAAGFTSMYCRYIDFTHQLIFTEMSLKQVLMLSGFHEFEFIKEKWPIKLTLRHMLYRSVRFIWFNLIKLAYFIEQPFEIVPKSFQIRIVVSAK